MVRCAAERVRSPSLSLYSGGSRGGARGETCPSPYLRVWMIAPLLISRSGSSIVIYHPNSYNTSPMLSLFAVMAGQRQGGINWNTLYFSKYINSHDSFYWQIFHEPLTLDIFMHIKNTSFATYACTKEHFMSLLRPCR